MDNEMTGAPEVKADVTRTMTELMSAFEAFKETNDRRLAELEKKSGADVVTTDKLARVEAALDANQRRMDEMVLKSRRPSLGGEPTFALNEKKSAFDRYVRSGDEGALRAFEAKGLSANGGDYAGLTVPDEIEAEVLRRLGSVSPIRSIASVRQVSTGSYRKPVTVAAPSAGWVSETAVRERSADDSAILTELTIPTMELYAMPAATQTLLDDSAVNLDQWLADEIETVFAEQETAAFVAGDGQGKPKGFASYNSADTADFATKTLGHVKTGTNGGFPAMAPADALFDLIYALKAGYRQNAHFVMNRKTQAAVRKFKDVDGNYLWTPPAIAGARALLLNFPVVEVEEMPEIGTGNNAIAFGDFRRGYLIVDRQGLRILRDPYSNKPYVLFYTTKRVGGGVQDFEAIKFLNFAE